MLWITSLALWLTSAAITNEAPDEASKPPLACEIGPVTRTFGGTPWQVYSCSDGATMVLVSAPGNPASPFVFIVSPGATHHKIYGEGAGDKKASAAARDQLLQMTSAELSTLLAETRAVAR